MTRYTVIASFIDAQSGQRKAPGDTVIADDARAEKLKAAKVIGSEIPDTPKEGGGETNGIKTDNTASARAVKSTGGEKTPKARTGRNARR